MVDYHPPPPPLCFMSVLSVWILAPLLCCAKDAALHRRGGEDCAGGLGGRYTLGTNRRQRVNLDVPPRPVCQR